MSTLPSCLSPKWILFVRELLAGCASHCLGQPSRSIITWLSAGSSQEVSGAMITPPGRGWGKQYAIRLRTRFPTAPRTRLVLIKGGRDMLYISSMFILRKTTNYNQEYNQGWNKMLIALNDLIISLNVLLKKNWALYFHSSLSGIHVWHMYGWLWWSGLEASHLCLYIMRTCGKARVESVWNQGECLWVTQKASEY